MNFKAQNGRMMEKWIKIYGAAVEICPENFPSYLRLSWQQIRDDDSRKISFEWCGIGKQ
jgi:hypothetical protein